MRWSIHFEQMLGTNDVYKAIGSNGSRPQGNRRSAHKHGASTSGIIYLQYDTEEIDQRMDNASLMYIRIIDLAKAEADRLLPAGHPDGPTHESLTEAEALAAQLQGRYRDVVTHLESDWVQFMTLMYTHMGRLISANKKTGAAKTTELDQLEADFASLNDQLDRATSERELLIALTPRMPEEVWEHQHLDAHRGLNDRGSYPARYDFHMVIARYVRPLADYIDSQTFDADGNPDHRAHVELRRKWTREYLSLIHI